MTRPNTVSPVASWVANSSASSVSIAFVEAGVGLREASVAQGEEPDRALAGTSACRPGPRPAGPGISSPRDGREDVGVGHPPVVLLGQGPHLAGAHHSDDPGRFQGLEVVPDAAPRAAEGLRQLAGGGRALGQQADDLRAGRLGEQARLLLGEEHLAEARAGGAHLPSIVGSPYSSADPDNVSSRRAAPPSAARRRTRRPARSGRRGRWPTRSPGCTRRSRPRPPSAAPPPARRSGHPPAPDAGQPRRRRRSAPGRENESGQGRRRRVAAR